MSPRAPLRLALPLIAVVMTAAVWFVPEPDPPVVDGGRGAVEVRRTVWACPVESGWVVAAGQVVPGEAARARVVPSDAAVDPLWEQADRWRVARPGGDALVLEQSGPGSGSVGWVAGARRGAAVLGACPSIVDDAWFVGLNAQNRTDGSITLINTGENRAVADLTWWGEQGPIESLDTTGLVVEPGGARTVAVSSVAAGEGAVAVRVSRRRGALAAIASDAGGTAAELVAPTAGAATEQVLVGLPPGDRTQLALVNPGTSTAHVAVEVRGRSGTFAAEGLADVTVEPEASTIVSVPGSVAVDRGSLVIGSDVPVVASAIVESGSDVARVVPADEISGPALVPARLDGRPVRLALSTGDDAVTVTVETFAADMTSLETAEVTVAAGATVVAPRPKSDDAAYLVLTPRGGTVGAGVWQSGGGLAAAPVRGAPVTVVAPGVSVR